MIKENQRILNCIHIVSDGVVLFISFPLGYWIRFSVFSGIENVPLQNYIFLALIYTVIQLLTYAAFGLYQSLRKETLRTELLRLWEATLLDTIVLQSLLFLSWGIHYSRLLLITAFLFSVAVLSAKRLVLRRLLQGYRRKGYNQKHVIVIGCGRLAQRYVNQIRSASEFGYQVDGYVSRRQNAGMGDLPLLGDIDSIGDLLERLHPDEMVAAMEPEDFPWTQEIIVACENAGVRLSIIPFYAEYMSSNPQFDDLNGLPMLNIRHIPLDNWANAFCKRAMDVTGSVFLLLVLSPVMLLCAIGVKLSSPGPAIFRQERVGRDKKRFFMYKFRSMRLNSEQNTGWSKNTDERRTPFGAWMRKCSLDELPQLWNVLRGEMSLVGPRPELPHYVEQFRNEVPLYMVKHQVRPGITGWAQVNGFRGDTSIKGRIEHDVYYIENWNLLFDLQILFMTVFEGKFLNKEQLKKAERQR